jgi:hypothetical protein
MLSCQSRDAATFSTPNCIDGGMCVRKLQASCPPVAGTASPMSAAISGEQKNWRAFAAPIIVS